MFANMLILVNMVILMIQVNLVILVNMAQLVVLVNLLVPEKSRDFDCSSCSWLIW
jgi:hypothetical protein